MATPSITMIPSGYKSQKVYSVLPTNGDGDLTFSRNDAGTRVNKDGLIEKVATDIPRLDYSDGSCPSLLLELTSTNLAIYSQDFSQSNWSVFDVSKSANSVLSTDGTLNGTRLTALSGTNRAFQQLVTVSADPTPKDIAFDPVEKILDEQPLTVQPVDEKALAVSQSLEAGDRAL